MSASEASKASPFRGTAHCLQIRFGLDSDLPLASSHFAGFQTVKIVCPFGQDSPVYEV
jgi:hypothetical protein